MSFKTLRSSQTPASKPKRFALQRLHVACAVGLLALAPAPSFALELGEAALRSGLGETLVVHIPYRLAPAEQLTPACVSLAAPRTGDALPAYSRASRIAITPTHIEIVGATRVVEPLIGLTVEVRCEATPHFLRTFELFVDLPAPAPAILSGGVRFAERRSDVAAELTSSDTNRRPAAAAPPPATTVAAPVAAPAPRAEAPARARGQAGGPVAQGETYVVVRGDTLSGIAARIADRPGTIRETADAIFAANPDAFARGNPDRLEAGRSLSIPILTPAPAARPTITATPPSPAEQAPSAATIFPSPEPEPVPAAELVSLPAEPTAEVAATDAVVPPVAEEAPAAASASVEPSPPAVELPPDVAPESADVAAVERVSPWLTALLALGVAFALSGAWLLVRRRKPEAPDEEVVVVRSSPPRRLVDPLAGLDVVEGQLARSDASPDPASTSRQRADATREAARVAPAEEQDSFALAIGPTDSVDIDVGTPVTPDERVDWFGDRSDAVAATVATGEALDATATARMPEPSVAADAEPKPHERGAESSVATAEDEQHTLTIVELEMLRQDYEAEHTMTQQANKALRDALADLKATQAGHAANAETATLEIPQAESVETQPTQRLRSAR